MLFAPIALNAGFGDVKGKWEDFWYLVTEETEKKVTVLVSAKCENIVANATVTIEFDGFVKLDFRIMSFWQFSKESEPRLTSLSLDVRVKSEYSTLFHYWPNDKTSIIPAPDVINAGATESVSYPFKPYLWTGWEDGGLGIFCGESDNGFELNNPHECVCIEKNSEYTSINLRIFDRMPSDWQKKRVRICG